MLLKDFVALMDLEDNATMNSQIAISVLSNSGDIVKEIRLDICGVGMDEDTGVMRITACDDTQTVLIHTPT